jgi:hypothetical protein
MVRLPSGGIGPGLKLPGRGIVCVHASGVNFVEPAVDAERSCFKPLFHGRVRVQMSHLLEHVELREDLQTISIVDSTVIALKQLDRRLRVFQPTRAVAGILSKISGCSNPFIAPQAEWPQTITSCTPKTATAYSILAETPTLTVSS